MGFFWKFKASIENQPDYKIKVIRSDNGTEYNSDRFEEFCATASIEHQLTVTCIPQQNGVSNGKSRTVMGMARHLMFEKNLPKKFWAEAVNTSMYLLNRLPTKALKKKTPFEALSGVKPMVKHLRIFGCICYAHIPEIKRDKLDKKVEAGIFAGYSSNAKGYKIFNPLIEKVIVSKNVKFDENIVGIGNKHKLILGSSSQLS